MVAKFEMAHLNKNLLAAINIKTTGLSFEEHEIYELAIIPINASFERDQERKWLDLKIRPDRINKVDWKGAEKIQNAHRVKDAIETGLERETAQEILRHWFEGQNLGSKLIAPVAHHFSFISRFMRMWLGDLLYESYFNDFELRDTMVIAKHMNDMSDYRAEPEFPYAKTNLVYLANLLKINHNYGKQRTALADAATVVDVYRGQMQHLNKRMIFT